MPDPPGTQLPTDSQSGPLSAGADSPLSAGQMGDLTKGFEEESAPLREQQRLAAEKPAPRLPKPERVSAPPSANIGNDAAMWLAAATALGGIAGALTRRSSVNALAAFTGTLEGLKEGNQQKFENNYKTWQASAKQVQQNNDAEIAEYKAAIENITLDERQRSFQLQVIAQKWRNKFMEGVAKNGDFPTQAAAFDALTNQNKQSWDSFEKLQEHARAREEKMEQMQFQRETQLQRVGAQQKQKADEAHDIANAIRSGEQPPSLTGMYGVAPLVRQDLAKTNTDLAKMQLDWQRAQAQVRGTNTQQRLMYLSASEAFDRTTTRIKELAEELKLKSVPVVNYGQLVALTQARTGPASEMATRYLTQMTTAQEQFASLLRGGYTPTNEAFALAFKQINPNMNLRNLEAGLEELKLDVKYRTNALNALSGGMGPQNPNQYLQGGGGARSLSDDDLMKQLGP